MTIYSESLDFHKKLKGKIEVRPTFSFSSKKALSLSYTPGVAAVSKKIFESPKSVFDLTMKGNSVAIVTDGSRVLGLGNIGASAAIPVMEGKAALFKEYGNVNAFPICVNSKSTEELVNVVKLISPVFGGVNLEDIEVPRCFEVEAQLQGLGIPVMHDDQHGTAIAVLAAVINACKVSKKRLEDVNVVISGAGAAGSAIARLLLCLGIDRSICTSVKSICVVDSSGILYPGRMGVGGYKAELALHTNKDRKTGSLADALVGADVFIGVSKGRLVSREMVSSMAKNPIVFALSNPEPEITPSDALKAGALIIGTGRSDLPNQINNALAFPGVFRGALDARASVINNEMKVAAAWAIASHLKKPSQKKILPFISDKKLHMSVGRTVKKAAIDSGVSQL